MSKDKRLMDDRASVVIAGFFSICLFAAQATAVTVPFTEDFNSSNANWVNFNSSGFLTHSATGGPDNGGYVSGTLSFEGRAVGATPITLRGRANENASGGNFIGDWIAAGAQQVSAFVRHDAPVPLTYFFRAADTANFPGGFFDSGVSVAPGVWTEILFDVSSDSSQAVSFEGSTWADVFDSIGHVQFGVFVPDGLASDTGFYNFDLDKVTVSNVPEPTTFAMTGTAILLLTFSTLKRRGK